MGIVQPAYPGSGGYSISVRFRTLAVLDGRVRGYYNTVAVFSAQRAGFSGSLLKGLENGY